MVKYEKTKNPNIIKRIRVIEDEIHFNKLKDKIEELKNVLKILDKSEEQKERLNRMLSERKEILKVIEQL